MSTKRYVITQGEHRAVAEPDAVISTLLGSCVACCLWDPEVGVGGMNHMLLASSGRGNSMCNLAGVNAMELMINDMLKLGALRGRLRAKAFGGARMISGLSDIGPKNAEFVMSFLEQEGIACQSSSLGGSQARHVLFTPSTGAAKVKVQSADVPEPAPQPAPVPQKGNDLELF
ncbi:MAG: chemotaxis protein CheD [Pseudomonadota bacterium]